MEMIEVKTAILKGPSLDWAVAQVDGVKTLMLSPRKNEPRKPFALFGSLALSVGGEDQSSYAPSTCWHCGGPLIESKQVDLVWDGSDGVAFFWRASCDGQTLVGETPLLAACRAIVAAHLGDTVMVPSEIGRAMP